MTPPYPGLIFRMGEEGQEMTDLRVGDASGFEVSKQRKTYGPVMGTHATPKALVRLGKGSWKPERL